MSGIEQSSFSLELDSLAEGEGPLSEVVAKPRKRGRPRKVLQEAVAKLEKEGSKEEKILVEPKVREVPTVKHSEFPEKREFQEKQYAEK
jgi:hypothetical protein